jgi:hypothetical protein
MSVLESVERGELILEVCGIFMHLEELEVDHISHLYTYEFTVDRRSACS